ncbi:MAG: hypothetical protein ACJ8KO_02835 [Sulfurifustaceae bacterium]
MTFHRMKYIRGDYGMLSESLGAAQELRARNHPASNELHAR